jgi:hypothetical protein
MSYRNINLLGREFYNESASIIYMCEKSEEIYSKQNATTYKRSNC